MEKFCVQYHAKPCAWIGADLLLGGLVLCIKAPLVVGAFLSGGGSRKALGETALKSLGYTMPELTKGLGEDELEMITRRSVPCRNI